MSWIRNRSKISVPIKKQAGICKLALWKQRWGKSNVNSCRVDVNEHSDQKQDSIHSGLWRETMDIMENLCRMWLGPHPPIHTVVYPSFHSQKKLKSRARKTLNTRDRGEVARCPAENMGIQSANRVKKIPRPFLLAISRLSASRLFTVSSL